MERQCGETESEITCRRETAERLVLLHLNVLAEIVGWPRLKLFCGGLAKTFARHQFPTIKRDGFISSSGKRILNVASRYFGDTFMTTSAEAFYIDFTADTKAYSTNESSEAVSTDRSGYASVVGTETYHASSAASKSISAAYTSVATDKALVAKLWGAMSRSTDGPGRGSEPSRFERWQAGAKSDDAC